MRYALVSKNNRVPRSHTRHAAVLCYKVEEMALSRIRPCSTQQPAAWWVYFRICFEQAGRDLWPQRASAAIIPTSRVWLPRNFTKCAMENLHILARTNFWGSPRRLMNIYLHGSHTRIPSVELSENLWPRVKPYNPAWPFIRRASQHFFGSRFFIFLLSSSDLVGLKKDLSCTRYQLWLHEFSQESRFSQWFIISPQPLILLTQKTRHFTWQSCKLIL